MISDEKRNGVADRLRSIAKEEDVDGYSYTELWDRLIDFIYDDLESYENATCADDLSLLADLIDRPAVKPVYPYDNMPDYVFCGECNTQIWNSANYCPQCGTRCVPYSEPFFDEEHRRIYETICSNVQQR